MAKKKTIQKSRRRLKRSVRRSLAAILMISAIGVAAVPVPENMAAPDDVTSPGGSTVRVVEYSYPMSDPDDPGSSELLPLDIDYEGVSLAIGSRTPHNAYTIRLMSDNTWQLEWQFQFFQQSVGGLQRGIINKYNNTYQQETVTLNANVISHYLNVSPTQYNKYYENNNDKAFTIVMPGDSTTSTDEAFLAEYFKDDYDKFVAEYRQYETKLSQWQANQVGDRPDPPEPFSRTIGQLSDNQKLKYYCDRNAGLKGCTLVRVTDMRDPSDPEVDNSDPDSVANRYTYIPRRIEGAEVSDALKFDTNLFAYDEDATVIGIGNNAFKDTRNVDNLTLASEIGYIGESAFENSFIKSISFDNVDYIDNYAFKNCSQLAEIKMGSTTTIIGTEAFYGTTLSSVSFPHAIREIGPGAFASCGQLQNLDFSGVSDLSAEGVRIGDYAFYNDVALDSINFLKSGSTATANIKTIGHAAFAVESGVTGNLTSFTFPTGIARRKESSDTSNLIGTGLGDLVLAGRTNLETVTMPADFGRNNEQKVPDNLLYNCMGLQRLVFPDDGNASCVQAYYDPDKLLTSVRDINFYVQGPELNRTNEAASPRKSTWTAWTAGAEKGNVPYLYIRNGVEYYEVSDETGTYLLCVNKEGVLISCVLASSYDTSLSKPTRIEVLTIPDIVANIQVTGIATGCFSNEVAQLVENLVIKDYSITAISDSVFAGWPKLETAVIGNSVASVGRDAFRGSDRLIDVTFHTPLNGYENFTIGDNAFTTGSEELTFHGDIVKGYAPFDWAMDKDNIIKEPEGIRVCYQSIGTYLKVMYNEDTGLVTLLDYPKYERISELLNESHSSELGSYPTYEKMREAQSYDLYRGGTFDPRRDAFVAEWIQATDDDAKKAVYASENYGPWINPEFCATAATWGTSTEDPNPDDTGLMDFLFEPIVAYAAEQPDPYFVQYPFVIGSSRYPEATTEENTLMYAVENIVVPDGVDSIDVYGYINSSDRNKTNAGIYLDRKLDTPSWNMYNSKLNHDADDNTDVVPGLFSGYYDDYGTTNAESEQHKRGNDRIKSVTLNSVRSLPDYAFDSCERLEYVILGPACSDIGTAPFRGCYTMTMMGGNDYYEADNGIVYSKNTDGSYTIEECLSARGKSGGVGAPVVSLSEDPKLSSVSTIKPGAFEDCKNVQEVNFGSNNTAGLTEIPADCFRNCEGLRTVVLPRTVNDIGSEAFVGANNLSNLTVYGKEVKISGRAFDSNKELTNVRTYKDSAVVRYVKEYGDEYKLYLPTNDEDWLGEQWKVTFLGPDYTLLEGLVDRDGNAIDNPQYVEDGKSPKRPQDPESSADWTFDKWVGMNNVDIDDQITEDTTFYAQGYSNSGMVGGKWVVEFYDSVDGAKIGPTQYIDPGKDAIAPGAPVHAGYTFDKWSDTTTNIQSNKSILALYKANTVNNPGGTTNTSGNTTGNGNNLSGNATNTSSGNTTSNSSSSSSSSTSTSSTTSGSDAANAMHRVTVINGSGSGMYATGATVVIAADEPAAGMKFKEWTTESNGVTFNQMTATATQFVMPENDALVIANFEGGVAEATPAAVPASTGGGSTGGTGGGTGGSGNTGNSNTRVDITKPGISNKDLATANVNGSTDNFIVKITETDEATRAVADALTGKYGSLENILYYAMDISLYDSTGTVQITDTSGLTVDITIPIPDALVMYGGNNMAGAVVNGNQLENLNESFTTINGIPCIRFTATHFSPYTVYVDTGNLTEGMLDTTPKTGDPIHPKWFLSLGLACLSVILFMKKDKKVKATTA